MSLQLFIGGFMSFLRYQCLFAHSQCPTHIVLCFCFVFLRLVYVTSFSGLSILFWLLLRINGCGLFFKQQMNIKLVNMIISLIYSQKSLYYWVVTRILENTVTNRIYEGQYSPIFLKQRFYCKVECQNYKNTILDCR